MNYLKKIFPLLLFLFSLSVEAQLGEGIYFGRKRYEKAEIILENGTNRTGYIRDFTNYKHKANSFSRFNSLEKNLGFLVKKFYFRTTKDSKDEKIRIGDVKSIIILDANSGEEVMHLDKLKLKTINSSYEAVKLRKEVMLPLISEGKWKIYGFSVGRAFLGHTIFVPYFKETQSEYAYIGIDIGRLNVFNFSKVKKRVIKAIEESSKKCPQFHNYFKKNTSEFIISSRDILDLSKKGLKNSVKIDSTIQNTEMRKVLMGKMRYDYNIKPYIQIQQKYNELCD